MGYGKLNTDGTLQSANLQHEGFVSLELFTKDENGNLYTHYQPDMVDGMYVADLAIIQTKALKEARKGLVAVIETHVQEAITAYNLAHSVMFENVHNCATYKDIETYPHKQFCLDIITFNATAWETGRTVEAQVLNGDFAMPTSEEFKAMLPTYNGVN
jgi:hypothetical protein